MVPSFWKDKKVLVTGHTGFKGSWLCLWLEQLGANVIGYALDAPTEPSLFKLANVEDGIISINGDICDYDKLLSTVAEHRPSIIIHMAAQALVRYSYENPVETFKTNAIGTLNLLESVRMTGGVKAVVNVTTDKCYENKEWVWPYRESEPLSGHDPYSSSKVCSEQITMAYRKSFFPPDRYGEHGLAIASARAGNVIGGGDWARDRLIPDCVTSWLTGDTVMIRNPNAIRPWQHVLESLSGYMLLAQRLYESGSEFAEAWNFGPDDSSTVTVQEAISSLADHWGEDGQWHFDDGEHPHEAYTLKLDSSKARTKLGWRPRWDIGVAIDKTADWYKAYQADKKSVRAKTLEQIDEYMKEHKC